MNLCHFHSFRKDHSPIIVITYEMNLCHFHSFSKDHSPIIVITFDIDFLKIIDQAIL